VVSAVKTADGLGVSRFGLEDEAGNRATVIAEAGIASGSRGKNELSRLISPGNLVSAAGIVHLSQGETVLRLRDCDEVHLLNSPDWTELDNEAEETDPDDTGEHTDPDTGDPDSTDPDGTDPTDGDGDSPGTDGGGSEGSGNPDTNPDTGDRGLHRYALLMLLSGLALWLLEKRRI
jgi:hypothetical protein